MTPQLVIRLADRSDCDWIVDRHGALYASEFSFDDSYGRGIAGKMQALLDRNEAFTRIVIAESDRERAGSIAISALPEGGAFLNFVLVAPERRRKGIAEALLADALDHARREGRKFARLETYSVLKSARKLYAKMGFVIVKLEAGVSRFGQDIDQEIWEMQL